MVLFWAWAFIENFLWSSPIWKSCKKLLFFSKDGKNIFQLLGNRQGHVGHCRSVANKLLRDSVVGGVGTGEVTLVNVPWENIVEKSVALKLSPLGKNKYTARPGLHNKLLTISVKSFVKAPGVRQYQSKVCPGVCESDTELASDVSLTVSPICNLCNKCPYIYINNLITTGHFVQ